MKYKRNNSRFSVKGRGDYMTKADFIAHYYCNLDHCKEFFFTMKWPTGYFCEKCGCTHFYYMRSKNCYRCAECQHDERLLTNTCFQDNKLPLNKLLYGVFLIFNDSEYVGISLEEIQFSHGTEIILDYNEFAKVFKDIEEVKLFIKKNFILDEVSISLNHIANGNNEKIELDLIPLNKMILLNVPLTNYLNDIEVYVDMKFSKSCFFKDLYDLTGNISYFYDEDDYKLHQESEERFDLFDYIEDEKIKFLNLAIIEEENSDEFNNAFNYLEDYEAALNKIDATYITIAYKDNQSVSYSNIEAGAAIIEYFGFENLVDDFGQANDTIAYAFKESQFVVVNQDDLFLGFELDRKINRYTSWKSTDELYCKDILVSNAHLTFPYFLNNLSINKVVLNSKNKDLIPNVTRNDFSNQMKIELSYAIGKAIHMWILDNQDLCVEERDLIALFIKKYYSDENKFYKQ